MGGGTLLLFFPSGGGSQVTGRAGATQFVGPFGWSFYFVPGAAPAPIDFLEALVAALESSPDLAALVGLNVFPLVIPEDEATPAIVYQLVSNPRDHHLGGPAGLARARVRLSCVSKTFATTVAVGKALRLLLDGYSGQLDGSVTVIETLLENEMHVWEPPADSSARGFYRASVDFLFRYRESKNAFSGP